MTITEYRGTCATPDCDARAYVDLHCATHRVAIDESKLGPDGFGGPVNLYRWFVKRQDDRKGWMVVKGQQHPRSSGPLVEPGTESVEVHGLSSQALAQTVAEALSAAFWSGRCQERRYHERLAAAELARRDERDPERATV